MVGSVLPFLTLHRAQAMMQFQSFVEPPFDNGQKWSMVKVFRSSFREQ